MPFQRRGKLIFAWEKQAADGQEFIVELQTRGVHTYWTRVLRAVAACGVVVVQYHNNKKPIALLASPRILYDILCLWHGDPNVNRHPAIETKLAFLAANASPPKASQFCPKVMLIRDRPSDFAKSVDELTTSMGGFAVIQKRKHPYALLVPVALLSHFQHATNANLTWREQALSWIAQILSQQQLEPG